MHAVPVSTAPGADPAPPTRGRRHMLMAALAATVVIAAPVQASAACMVCWLGGCWTLWENSCQEAMSQLASNTTCFTLGLTASSNSDYVLTGAGGPWLVRDGRKIPFAPDRVGAGYKALGVKYAKADAMDPKVVLAFERDMNALFPRTLKGDPLTPEKLARFTRATGLKVRGPAREASLPDARVPSKMAP